MRTVPASGSLSIEGNIVTTLQADAVSNPQALFDSTPVEEERVASYLAEMLRIRFTGEGDEHRIIRYQFPSKALQLGILPALPQPDPGDPITPEQLAQRLNQAPSSMGLDFRLAPQGETATLEIGAYFSIYVQRYPERDEQFDFYTGDAEQNTREKDESDDDDGSDDTMRLMPKFERFDIELSTTVPVVAERGEKTVELTGEVAAQIGAALTDHMTVYPFLGRPNQTLPVSAMRGTDAQWWSAITHAEGDARSTPHTPPRVEMIVAWQPDGQGTVRVQVTLANRTLVPARARRGRSTAQQKGAKATRTIPREVALFNCRLRVFPAAAEFQELRFHEAPRDFRYRDARSTWALGRGCVGRREGEGGPIVSDTWPIYRQPRTETRRGKNDELAITFAELKDPATMMGPLGRVMAAMKVFDGEWDKHLRSWQGDAASKAECEHARNQWNQETAAFERGVACLAADDDLASSFRAANEVFDRIGADKDIVAWRLFQLVFIVIQLTALRARVVDDDDLRADLDVCDVLWFATGGGKTEAYLGLIVVALFYDRYRGKLRGATALLRYPLRMLSVQQLQRLLVAVAAAEDLRRELLDRGEGLGGDAFALGYWAGFTNSPNEISSDYDEGETTIEWWQRALGANASDTNKRRIVTACPYVGCRGDLELSADVSAVRLRYVCGTCKREAPVYMTDEEVYRCLPAVVVCTVDKLARVAWADEFVNLLAGPAYWCPDHGYFTWHRTGTERDKGGRPKVTDRCGVGQRCKRPADDYRVVDKTLDPAPSLIIQDELHLLEEELGTFDSHYETLMDVLFEELGDGLRPKVLAATATIEGGEAQVRNLYARHIREFPSQGYDRWNSFYVETDHESARRLYVGALPNRPDVVEFGAQAQASVHQELAILQADPAAALVELRISGHDSQWMAALLKRYELTLGYVNRKENATRIQSVLRRLHYESRLPFELQMEVLVAGSAGEASLADIAHVLDRITTQYDDGTEPEERLRALVATSLISHGVDLDMLNVEVINRMTPTVAGYVQATSRAGRSHTGLIIVGFDRRIARERSFYQHFLDYHRYIDRMIAPVPVNRFARFAPHATMPGIVSALVLHLLSRRRLDDKGLDARRPVPALYSRWALRNYWNSAEGPPDKKAALLPLVRRAMGIGMRLRERVDGAVLAPAAIFAPVLEQWLEEAADREFDRQLDNLQNFQTRDVLPMKLSPKPLQSFRSVDDPMEFRCLAASTDIQGDLVDPTARRAPRKRTAADTKGG
jgi:hypothetical protein